MEGYVIEGYVMEGETSEGETSGARVNKTYSTELMATKNNMKKYLQQN